MFNFIKSNKTATPAAAPVKVVEYVEQTAFDKAVEKAQALLDSKLEARRELDAQEAALKAAFDKKEQEMKRRQFEAARQLELIKSLAGAVKEADKELKLRQQLHDKWVEEQTAALAEVNNNISAKEQFTLEKVGEFDKWLDKMS